MWEKYRFNQRNTNLSLILWSNCTEAWDLNLHKEYKFTKLSDNLVTKVYNTLCTQFLVVQMLEYERDKSPRHSHS